MESYYDILGVNETSSQEEIKKKYKKLAVEHHPDKGGNEETFKKISEAYDTLGDTNKRSQYDTQRNNPFSNMGGNPFGGNPFDIFSQMFGSMGGNAKRKNADTIVTVQIGVIESYKGGKKEFTYRRKEQCGSCSGSGGNKVTCSSCNGQGFNVRQVGNGFFNSIQKTTCGVCSGKGFKYTELCGSCHGAQTFDKTNTLIIDIPKGINNGMFFKSKNTGDFVNGQYSDLLIKVEIVGENGFERDGDNLIYYFELNKHNFESDKIIIPHPDGEMGISMPNEYETDKPLRVKGKGFIPNTTDLYIKFNFKFKKN
jgi:molecular chaperone DnaJ